MYLTEALPALNDNYIWMLFREDTDEAWAVDPGASAPVRAWMTTQRKRLAGVLLTHHHRDHVDGVADLTLGKVPVVGPATKRHPLTTDPLTDGDLIEVLGLTFEVMAVAGHTPEHIAFYASAYRDSGLLYCGDTLFSAGCGRLLGGTAEQLYLSLQRIAQLPDSTLVCCAHEYTLANIRFAQSIEPENQALRAYKILCEQRRSEDQPTLPSHIGLEKEINPFLRTNFATVTLAAAEKSGRPLQPGAECFTELRSLKDTFR